jgi:hypothetical protein
MTFVLQRGARPASQKLQVSIFFLQQMVTMMRANNEGSSMNQQASVNVVEKQRLRDTIADQVRRFAGERRQHHRRRHAGPREQSLSAGAPGTAATTVAPLLD